MTCKIARFAAVLAIAALAALTAQAALGYWSGGGNDGDGNAAAGAATVNQGAAPTVSESGSANVVVSWGSSGLSNGVPVDGYIVKRYNAATGAQATIGADCSGTIAATTCTEPNTPIGNWVYSVTPVIGSNWRGAESIESGAVNTGPGSMTLSTSLFGGTVAPLPSVVSGTVSAFGPNEAINFFLDGTVPLTGSPSKVGANGSASISITLPSGVSDGTHSLSVRSSATEASAGILVDTTPPTIEVTVDPPPNAAGWNKTAPVEVGGTVSDGDGSGVAFAKYTEDGSDPKTSATAKFATGPVSVAATATLKFYLADNAGNQSPVETQQVKIDTTFPYFTVDFVDITGGAYVEAANEETGEPGDSYYRGAAPGSFKFLMTPLALGGSPAISAGFSELPADAVGFSFDSSTVTTPTGGPFLSNAISWVAGATSTPTGTISLTNEAGSTFGSTGPLHNDSTPPSGGSIDATGLSGTGGRYSTSLNLNLMLEKGADAASGLADGTGPSDVPAKLLRASAALSSNNGTENGICGTYSAFTQVGGANPVSPVSDTVPTNDRCYLYRYLVSDHVGNIATYTSSDIKVQTTAPVLPEPLPVGLGEAGGFAVLGASTVTSARVSALTGNLGVSPGTAITGFPPGTVDGSTYSADPAANQAQADVGAAYADAAGRAGTPVSGSLGGQTFTRGVYKAASFSLTGSLTLDAQNDPAAVFVFQAGSTLTTTASSHMNLINGAQACNVFWQVGSSATLGASSTFTGTILAFTSISTAGSVAMNGRVLAHNGAVTLIEDTIAAPQCAPPVGTAPTNAVLTPVSGTGTQSVSGSTIFYNPAQSGSFNVDSSASSSVSGIAQMTFPAIAGFSGGGAVAFPFSGASFRDIYAWSANGASLSPGAQPISATNNAGQTSTNNAAFTVTKDAVSPSGGSVDASGLGGTGGRYSTSTTVNVAFEAGTDGGSGLAPSGAQLLRASAPLASDGVANGNCGGYGTYTQVGTNDPSTPRNDTIPADRTCYRYEYVIADKVGNQTVYTSPDVKVDATAPPAPALSFSALANAYWSGAGTQVYYRPGAPSGGFQLTANSADTTAGTVGYGFPTFPNGWSASSGGSGIRNYSWSAANPTAPSGAQSVTTTNNAGGSATSSFTATPDATLPIGGSLSYANGYTVGSTISVSFGKGTDAISGLNAASGIVEGSMATLSAGACGTFGPFSALATNPLSGVSFPVTSGGCYQYRYLISDNVGNQTVYASASVAKVDNVSPIDSLSLEGAVNASQSGSTIFYRGNVAGSFKIVDAVSDAASGPASATFPAIATTGWVHNLETIGTPTGGPYASTAFSWTPEPANPTVKNVFSTDVAGKSSTNASVLFADDVVAPSGGSIAYTNGVLNSTFVSIATANGSDGGSGINAATTTIKRDVAPLTTSTETCGAFPGTYATTVNLVGSADTSVPSGHCYRYEYLVSDKVGNQAVYTSASVAKVDTSGPQVTAIDSRQSGGSAGNGQLEVGDKLTLTFNQSLATASVPASFSGATEAKPALANVTLTIPGITKGALDTGSGGYVLLPLTTTTFGGTVVLANNGTATTVTLSVTSISGVLPQASKGGLVFNPATSITDGGGDAASGTFTNGSNFKLF
jgi:hypothetical protein